MSDNVSKLTITISRQFASMGRTIGQCLSKQLGIELLDRDIVALTAQKTGLSKREVSDNDETARKGFFMRENYFFNLGVYGLPDEIYQVQQNIILDYADKMSCIIVGRNADYILRDRPNVLNVHIYAPLEKRLENCIKNLNMDEKAALASIKDVDAARQRFRKLHCPKGTDEFSYRNLMLDSSKYSIEDCADIIAQCAKKIKV